MLNSISRKLILKYIGAAICTFLLLYFVGHTNIKAQDNPFSSPLSGQILPETSISKSLFSFVLAFTIIILGIAIYKTEIVRERFSFLLNPYLQNAFNVLIPGHRKRLFENTLQSNEKKD